MKTVLLPSGLTCRPVRLRSIYSGIKSFRYYDEVYGIASRISDDPCVSVKELWDRNPYVVFSVYSSDLAEYNEKIHPFIIRKSGQSIREAAKEMREKLSES